MATFFFFDISLLGLNNSLVPCLQFPFEEKKGAINNLIVQNQQPKKDVFSIVSGLRRAQEGVIISPAV